MFWVHTLSMTSQFDNISDSSIFTDNEIDDVAVGNAATNDAKSFCGNNG